jgi:DNA-binding response OmpR family regulator
MRVLIIEDNERLAQQLRRMLEEQAYEVLTVGTGHEGEALAARESFDLVILDLMLPDHDGVQLCRNLRRRKVSTPVLMLTALSSTEDKVEGLNAGADDYVIKPFEPDEFLARVRALLRRAQPNEGVTLTFEGIEMDLLKRRVTRDGTPIELTAKEFALLEYFLRSPERVLTRTNIGERVWGLLFEEESNVIEVYVSRLRRKIDKGFDKQLIHTVVGTGYILSADGPSV